jgi:hypothetical protein
MVISKTSLLKLNPSGLIVSNIISDDHFVDPNEVFEILKENENEEEKE